MKKQIAVFLAVMLGMMPAFPAHAEGYPAGDVNADGEITVLDAVLLSRYLAEDTEMPDGFLVDFADANKDSYVTLADLAAVIKQLSGWILEPKGTVHYGEATFYGGGYEGGCAMLDPVSKDEYLITALNIFDYNEAELAGAYLEVTGELGKIHVLVTDLLPEGKKGDLDLCEEAFPLIAPVEKGRVPISWKIIPLDSAENAPMGYRYQEGSSQFWAGVQVRNHRWPIEKLEYLNKDGEFVEMQRKRWNFFNAPGGMGKGPFTFRITDIYGQSVIDYDIPLSTDPNEIVPGHVQLPL